MKIFAADPDEKFLLKLEKQLLFAGEDVMTVMCSDSSCFSKALEENRDADVFLVSEELADEKYSEISDERVYILGNSRKGGQSFGQALYVYKYDIKNFLDKIVFSRIEEETGCRFSVFCSPSGGTGTTTAAYLTAEALYSSGKEVLFVSLDPFQNNKYLTEDGMYLSEDEALSFSTGDERYFDKLIKKIKENGQFCMPAFIKPYISFGIGIDEICRFIRYAVLSGCFEYVAADISSFVFGSALMLMSEASKVIVCIGDGNNSEIKFKRFNEAIDCTERKKFLFLCIGERKDTFTDSIELTDTVPFYSITEMKEHNPYRKLSLLI